MKPATLRFRWPISAPAGRAWISRASRRPLTTSPSVLAADSSKSSSSSAFGFGGGPSPPRLPKEEQDIFEALQRSSTGAFSTPRPPPGDANDQSSRSDGSREDDATTPAEQKSESTPRQDPPRNLNPATLRDEFQRAIEARGKGEELHPNVVRGAQPEFEGDKNPKTGEIGGPKNEPLRWGAQGEWSYNGRTTDF